MAIAEHGIQLAADKKPVGDSSQQAERRRIGDNVANPCALAWGHLEEMLVVPERKRSLALLIHKTMGRRVVGNNGLPSQRKKDRRLPDNERKAGTLRHCDGRSFNLNLCLRRRYLRHGLHTVVKSPNGIQRRVNFGGEL